MLASLLIVFREVLEAGLIVGVVLAATEGLQRRARWISGAILIGVFGAIVLAVFAGQLSNALAGHGQDLFNAAILLAAVAMLGWHHLWMATHGRHLAARLKDMGSEIAAGRASLMSMAAVVALAILREGAEVVLFLYGVVASSTEPPTLLLAGGLGGLALGALASVLLYRGLLAIPAKRLFQVTEGLLTALAAGLAGQAAALLASIGDLPALGDQVWDTSWLLREDSLAGKSLHALVGYADRPYGVQVLAYGLVLTAFVVSARVADRR
jgi:high-affinity iron transporter